MPVGSGPSSLLLLEYLSAQDSRFLEVLNHANDPKVLAAVADRWKKDFRPWARQQILAYLEMPLSRQGHQPLVRRLFKHAEERGDHELMGAFMAAFDGLVRRWLRRDYDRRSRTTRYADRLVTPSNSILPGMEPDTVRADMRLFSAKSRYYLRRRAWRYFRRLGHQRPDQYIQAVAAGLKRYNDADLTRGESLLDSWGLMHACFFRSPVIAFGVSHANLVRGRSLGVLSAAPYLPKLWQDPGATAVLMSLVAEARARLVRVWAMQLLRADHGDRLADVPVKQIVSLLDHADEEVQQFGAELLQKAHGLEKLPLESWLAMLQTKNATALAVICDLMKRHVTADRLDLAGRVQLAISRATPIARLGFDYLKLSSVGTTADRDAVAAIAGARCESIGREMALWALALLGEKSVYDTARIVAFFDSLNAGIRSGAWEWLTPDSAGWGDSVLYSRLLETPYEDIRLNLVQSLEQRAGLPGASAKDLSGMWCAVLLGVHRGGRHKLKAIRRIAETLRGEPKNAEQLIPVLAIAMRSVRAPEARGGLAAVVGVLERRPELQPVVERFFPELQLSPVET